MKKLTVLFLGVLLFLNINTIDSHANELINLNKDTEEVTTRATFDEYQWVYRMVNGREQKRLWNLSRGKWDGNWKWV
mgnify:CR=1 FL=1